MFKISKLLLVVSLVLGGFLLSPPQKADAAWSSWQNATSFGSTCQVRVYTDLTSYTAVANTVDAMAESKGNCSKMYYTMSLREPTIAWGIIDKVHSGYFTTGTPLKSFNINGVKKTLTTEVTLGLRKAQGGDTVIEIYSNNITIYPQ